MTTSALGILRTTLKAHAHQVKTEYLTYTWQRWNCLLLEALWENVLERKNTHYCLALQICTNNHRDRLASPPHIGIRNSYKIIMTTLRTGRPELIISHFIQRHINPLTWPHASNLTLPQIHPSRQREESPCALTHSIKQFSNLPAAFVQPEPFERHANQLQANAYRWSQAHCTAHQWI